jgi:hypothetical protein
MTFWVPLRLALKSSNLTSLKLLPGRAKIQGLLQFTSPGHQYKTIIFRILADQLKEVYRPDAEGLCSEIIDSLNSAAERYIDHPGINIIFPPCTRLTVAF